ncbi:diacylglycerol/lipid kinase family protein [Gordonia crocea]|uniref:Diacylglycerol kinase n=1 Tax=Gordonia crocea TaxID=589162 RepID=A0A7M3SU58_9ACTN|nr:YegS/Rv2252/BmrU family lipid kinase [Gordonia crocea]GED96182.1 diacylglycerol kinase [Gordonia crocea]
MPTRTIAVLANPMARKGTGRQIAGEVDQLLRGHGVAARILVGADLADAERLAAQAVADDTVEALVAVGGDGSIRLALEAAAGSSTPVGIIPAGTANDLARTLGVPLRDLPAAVGIIVDGHTAPIDLGRARLAGADGDPAEALFVTVAATGFDADVTDRANHMRWPRGKARYLVAAVAEVARLAPRRFTVRVDGDTVVDGDVIFTAIGNTRSYGGGMLITPDADLHDGLLDATIATKVPGVGRMTLLRLLPTVFSGKHVEQEMVRTARGSRIEVDSTPPALVSVDGDIVGRLPATFETIPDAVRVLVPRTA